MSQNPSRRYSPYSRPPSSSSLPSERHHLPLAGHRAASNPSDGFLSPASAPSPSPHPTTNSMTEYPPVPPLFHSQPIFTPQPPTSSHTLEPSMYQDYSPAQQPMNFAPRLFPQGPSPSQPCMNNPYLDPTMSQFILPLPSSHLPATLEPVVTHQPESTVYRDLAIEFPHEQPLTFPTHTSSPYSRNQRAHGMFSGSHDFSMTGNMFIDNSTSSDNFMEKLLQNTIIGAEFDSSARHPPPRCHPGTRLAIIERCKVFISECKDEGKLRWVVGPAGVGKSAIMQIVAEETPDDVILGASVFLSVNGRQDGTKTFSTIGYQLAAKLETYRQFIRIEINRDPSLVHKSLPAQFQKFIIEPFIHRHLFDLSNRFLIIIDGLDECDNPLTQRELLGLISDFCLKYPISPLVWIIASRPEPHITSFFDDARVMPAYTREEVAIDSNEACEDVQQYLRAEFKNIQLPYPSLKRRREWPTEFEFTKIATAAGGLFAYASTVARYIGDPHYRDPAAQLRHVLEAIDAGPRDGWMNANNPLAQLDALYSRIISHIPDTVMINTRTLLLYRFRYSWNINPFRMDCNLVGFTEDAAYGAVSHLHSVLRVPEPDRAGDECLQCFHKSFQDYLSDFKRSGFSPDIDNEAIEIEAQFSMRIVKELRIGTEVLTSGGKGVVIYGGDAKCVPGLWDDISISWEGPSPVRNPGSRGDIKCRLYTIAMSNICSGFKSGVTLLRNMLCFHSLTTLAISYKPDGVGGPYYMLRGCGFDEFHSELLELGKLKQVPLRTLDYAAICGRIELRFTSLTGTAAKISNAWNPSCAEDKEFGYDKHEKEEIEVLPQRRGWLTHFGRSFQDDDEVAAEIPPRCNDDHIKASHSECLLGANSPACTYCSRRLARYFSNNPDQLATVFVDATEMCYVELSFLDPDDGVSEWRYRFFHSGLPTGFDA